MPTDLTDDDIAKQRDASQRLERDDYNNAIAGRETGRMTRFGAKSKDEREAEQRKTERVFRDALDRLMQDAEYRALYEQLGEDLSGAERNADQTIAAIQIAIGTLEDDIADIEARAAKGPDGQLVFKTADGRVVNADGKELPLEIAEGIIWPPNAPSAEAYFGTREQRSELTTQLAAWQGYRNGALGDIRNRYDDRDTPMSKDDLKDTLDTLDAARPTPVSLETSQSSQEAELSSAPITFPKIGS